VAQGCGQQFRTPAGDGFAVCRHLVTPATSSAQAWAAATEYLLTPRVAGPDVSAGLDQLLIQWRDHLGGIDGTSAGDSAARVRWPTRDTAGVRALLRHGLTPMSVVAARPAGRNAAAGSAGQAGGVTIRPAGPADLATATGFQLDVIKYDEQFGVGRMRPATQTLVREDLVADLNRSPSWIWLAEGKRDREPAGLLILQPPEQASWIAPVTSSAPVAYLATMFVRPGERGAGVGAALVSQAHAAADDSGTALILLHYAQVSPLSGPFWARMGYRPLWTQWGAGPAAVMR